MKEVKLREENIEEIQGEIETTLWPENLANLKVRLAGQYFYFSEQLIKVLEEKNNVWEDFRKDADVKSDLQAERKWQRTDRGVDEMKLKLKMKAIEKLLSAVSSKISVAENEKRLSK